MTFKPILAARVEDASQLRYPLIASPKVDGIRCLIVDGKPVSRTLKPIPNLHIVKTLSGAPSGLDGELLVGDTFHDTTSGVMSVEGHPDFVYAVFDYVPDWKDLFVPYLKRLERLEGLFRDRALRTCHVLPWERIESTQELEEYEARQLAIGFEGVCLRALDAPYRCGRATFRSHDLLKLKRFEDAEAKVIGVEELRHNTNPAVRNALGALERSSAKGGRVGGQTLGALHVRDLSSGVEFHIGTGFTSVQRQQLWVGREKIVGRVVKYKYQPHGVKDAPRLPVFLGFRDASDL